MELLMAGKQNYQIKFFIYGKIFFSVTLLKRDIFTNKKKKKKNSDSKKMIWKA